MLAEIALTNRKFTGNPHPRLCGKGEERGKITDVKSRLAFTRPRCLAADLELASVDFATVEAQPVCGGEETFTAISSNVIHNPFGLGMKQMTAEQVMFT